MKKLSKIVAIIAATALCAVSLAACGNSGSKETTTTFPEDENFSSLSGTLYVYAAASLTETLTEIIQNFETDNPGVDIQVTFDSSGTLKTQIEEGGDCDIFIAASQKPMNQLDITADSSVNTDGLDFVDSETRINLLENQVVLCVPNSDSPIQSFDDLKNALLNQEGFLFAMGNEDVPVGAYTQKILTYLGLDEAALAAAGKITYGTNVKDVTSKISEGTVDAGVVYCTDAFSADLTIADVATKDMCGQVIYPAAIMKNCQNREVAEAFMEYLQTPASSMIFESVGFMSLSE